MIRGNKEGKGCLNVWNVRNKPKEKEEDAVDEEDEEDEEVRKRRAMIKGNNEGKKKAMSEYNGWVPPREILHKCTGEKKSISRI